MIIQNLPDLPILPGMESYFACATQGKSKPAPAQFTLPKFILEQAENSPKPNRPAPVTTRKWVVASGKNAKVFERPDAFLKENFKTIELFMSVYPDPADAFHTTLFSPEVIENILGFLNGEQGCISPKNILDVLKAIDYFEIPKLVEYFQKRPHVLLNCLKKIDPDLTHEDRIALAKLIINNFSPEFFLELLPNWLQNPETANNFSEIHKTKDEHHQFFLDMHTSLAKGMKLELSPEFQLLDKKIEAIEPGDFINFFENLPKAKKLIEPIFKRIMKGISKWDDAKRQTFLDKFKPLFESSAKMDPIINDFIDKFKAIFSFKLSLNKPNILSSIKADIKTKIDELDKTIIDAKAVANENTDETKTANLKNLIQLLKITKKCLENLEEATDPVLKSQNKGNRIGFTLAILAGVFAVGFLCAMMVILFTVPMGPPHEVLGRYGWETIRDPIFSAQAIALSSTFGGMVLGAPIIIAIIWGILFSNIRRKVKHQHLLPGIRDIIQSPEKE